MRRHTQAAIGDCINQLEHLRDGRLRRLVMARKASMERTLARLDRCLVELALRQKQADFLELLSCGKQIALGGVGEKLQSLGRRALPLALETGSDPARQVGALQRKDFERDTALLERGEP